jgi:hypothetical protein
MVVNAERFVAGERDSADVARRAFRGGARVLAQRRDFIGLLGVGVTAYQIDVAGCVGASRCM